MAFPLTSQNARWAHCPMFMLRAFHAASDVPVCADLPAPWRAGAASALRYLNLVPQGVSDKLFGRLAAALELISRTSLTYTRPPYDIGKIMGGNQDREVPEGGCTATR